MKRVILLYLLLRISVFACADLFDSAAFKMSSALSHEKINMNYRISISSDTSFALDTSDRICGLAISGKTILKDKDAVVRVILVDDVGQEYLVFEDMYMYPNDMVHEFSDVAIETAILANISPSEIKIFINNAQAELSHISVAPAKLGLSQQVLYEKRKEILASQEELLINRWNQLNSKTGQYWVAGKTTISGLPYTERKKILGATSDHYLSDGFEYYVGGFFVIRAHGVESENLVEETHETRDTNSNYVESFDWRNRHGKNWMTSVKNQISPYNNISGNGGCWIFGSIAALESHISLYYNKLLNLDLSEQEIGSCVVADSQGYPSLHTGGFPSNAYNYIRANGIVGEDCFPFQNDSTIPCEEKCENPQYVANISNYSFGSNGANQLKNELINRGPIASGICNHNGLAHVMCLCGYGTIKAGTHVEYVPHAVWHTIDTIIPSGSNLIGKTFWIYKNSYGVGAGINGYLYAVYENESDRAYTTTISYPVSISTLNTNDIVCEDADNDGYYFWGLGPKPDNCPICCPDISDGDDSNPMLAEMDSYGHFSPYAFPYSTTIVNSDTTWDSDTTHCGNIVVTNNATLTITAQLTMNPAAKIIVQNGGTLIVDAGNIVNANIDAQSSAKLQLLNNGTLYLKQSGNLNIRIGAEVDIDYGRILLQ